MQAGGLHTRLASRILRSAAQNLHAVGSILEMCGGVHLLAAPVHEWCAVVDTNVGRFIFCDAMDHQPQNTIAARGEEVVSEDLAKPR